MSHNVPSPRTAQRVGMVALMLVIIACATASVSAINYYFFILDIIG